MINDETEKNNKEKITIKFLLPNNNYNYMINDEREITIKKKSMKFLLPNNYNYIINDEREKNDKEKITINFLLPNNNYNFMINNEREKTIKKNSQLIFYCLIIIIII